MFKSHHCGALRETHIGTEVTLAGWAAKVRDKGFVLWIDLRDRYGITQLVLDEERCSAALLDRHVISVEKLSSKSRGLY